MLVETADTLKNLVKSASLVDRLSDAVEQSEAAQSLRVNRLERSMSLEGIRK